MQEIFLVVYACGDTFSVKGVYFHFRTAMEVALAVEKEHLESRYDYGHMAYIYKLGLNKTYRTEGHCANDTCVFAIYYNQDGTCARVWHDKALERSYCADKQ